MKFDDQLITNIEVYLYLMYYVCHYYLGNSSMSIAKQMIEGHSFINYVKSTDTGGQKKQYISPF